MIQIKNTDGTWREISGAEHMVESTEIGSVMAYAGLTVPRGYLSCDGQAVSRTEYSELFKAIGTTWGEGDGTTTFNIPKLNDGSFLEGGESVGTAREAGLPKPTMNNTGNHSHTANSSGNHCHSWNGYYTVCNDEKDVKCASVAGVTSGSGGNTNYAGEHTHSTTTNGNHSHTINEDTIYGKSATVQPKSSVVKYCIRYTKTVTTNMSIEEIFNMLYPIGTYAFGTHPNFGTWTEIEGDRALWLKNTVDDGTEIAQALPNIKGNFGYAIMAHGGGDFGNGAFTKSSSNDYGLTFGSDNLKCDAFNFNAHNSNGVYQDGVVKVQPDAYVMKVFKRTA